MLGLSSHPFKVNFCKFTNETRNAIEDATLNSGPILPDRDRRARAPAAATSWRSRTDYIMMADDGSTSVSLPEIPLLGVLPGTGGLTRLVDKRRVRRDRADFFCTIEEGVKGKRAVDWELVDEVVPRTQLARFASRRALEFAARANGSARRGRHLACPARARGRRSANACIAHSDASRSIAKMRPRRSLLKVQPAPLRARLEEIHSMGAEFWPLALARELEDAILHLRFNEETLRTWIFRTRGDPALLNVARRVARRRRRRLARARNPPLPEAHAEADRRQLALDLRA